jgi:hypothetical protein
VKVESCIAAVTREEKEQLLSDRLRGSWWMRAQGWVLIDAAILGALFFRHHNNLFLGMAIVGAGFLFVHRIRVDRAKSKLGL